MFDTMISKTLIQWIWLGWSGLIALVGLIAVFQAGSGFEAFIVLIGIALSLAFVRVLCEGMIVIFMIHENLAGSRIALEKLQARQGHIGGGVTQTASAASYVQPQPQPVSPPVTRSSAPSGSIPTPAAAPKPTGTNYDAPKKDDYNDRMMARREQLEKEAKEKRGY